MLKNYQQSQMGDSLDCGSHFFAALARKALLLWLYPHLAKEILQTWEEEIVSKSTFPPHKIATHRKKLSSRIAGRGCGSLVSPMNEKICQEVILETPSLPGTLESCCLSRQC